MPKIAVVREAAIAALSNPGTSQTVFSLTSGGAAQVQLPGKSRFDGKSFILRASGRVTTGASMTVNLGIQFGSSTTVGSNTTITNPSATVNGSVPFALELLLTTDSVSKTLSGIVRGFIGGTAIAQAAITPASNFDPAGTVTLGGSGTTQEVNNPFVATVTFAASNAANVAVLTELSLSEV